METGELDTFTEFAEMLAAAAAQVILPRFRSHMLRVNTKSDVHFDPVTEADQGAERVMREMIAKRYPSHGILGEEESPVAGKAPFKWVLDPIDGTGAFISGLPLWGTLVALNDGRRPIIGVMNQPFTSERFIGARGNCRFNGIPARTRVCPRLSQATIFCTSPSMFRVSEHLDVLSRIAAAARLVRYGGECYAYCMVACGCVDAVVETNLEPYDVQALIPIVEGAGGIMTTWDGGDAQDGGSILACGDKSLHAEILSILNGK